MNTQPIEIVRNNSGSITVTVRDAIGDLVNLTGYTMLMAVKNQAEDTDDNAVIGPLTGVISTPASGVGICSWTSTQSDVASKMYTYDVRIEDAAGDNRLTVVIPSPFTVIENVTKG